MYFYTRYHTKNKKIENIDTLDDTDFESSTKQLIRIYTFYSLLSITALMLDATLCQGSCVLCICNTYFKMSTHHIHNDSKVETLVPLSYRPT